MSEVCNTKVKPFVVVAGVAHSVPLSCGLEMTIHDTNTVSLTDILKMCYFQMNVLSE